MTILAQKQQMLADIASRLDATIDALGQPIDQGIRSTVLYLQALGITTSQSCEGHRDHGRPWPWIRIEATGEPMFRFQNELEIYNQTSREFGVSVTNLQKGLGADLARQTLWHRLMQQKETSEFKAWSKKNRQIRKRLAGFLDQFYASHLAATEIRLGISKIGTASFELESNEPSRQAYYRGELSQSAIETIKRHLPARQAEMRAFGEYLESQFWLEDTTGFAEQVRGFKK